MATSIRVRGRVLALACAVIAPAAAQQGAAPTAGPAQPETATIAVALPDAGDAAKPSRSEGTHNRVIEEVMVTAQKREENLQDVPIAIQAFSGDALGARGVENTEDLGLVVPSLQFTSAAGFSLVFIRGLGSDNFIPSADPSIATYIDGIYIPQGADTKNSLGNVKRVEVLKGPQGTLFGRNATGGAISVVTEEPGDEYKGSAEGVFGNDGQRSLKASYSMPVTSWLSASLAGSLSHHDSNYTNPNFTTEPDEIKTARARVNIHPTDDLSLSLTAYYSDQQGLGSSIGKNTDPSLLGRTAGIQPERDDYNGQTDYPASTAASQSINYAILTWKLPALDVKVLGSYQNLTTRDSEIDFDGSPMPLSSFSGPSIYTHLQTGEVQFVSNDDSWMADKLKWVTGLYYLHSVSGVDPAYFRAAPGLIAGLTELGGQGELAEVGQNLQNLFNAFGLKNTPLGDGGVALSLRGVLATKSGSAYAQGTYYFTDWLDLTLGGRFQREDRYLTKAETDLSDFSGTATPRVLNFQLKGKTEDNFSPKAVVSVHPTDNSLLYFSYAVGFKSGTFNIVNLYTPPNYIVPEKVTTFEIGAKLQFLDGLLRINGAVFNNDVKNLQSGFVSLLSGGAVRFITVPKARSRGAEADGTFVPLPNLIPGLALTGNVAYVDASYTDFNPCPGFQKGTGVYSANLDCDGNNIVRTPKVSGGIGVVQTIDVGDGSLEVAVDEYYNSGFYYDPYNTVKEKPYELLNFRAGYEYNPWRLRTTVFIQNLLDRRYHYTQFQTDFGVISTLADPREFGVRLNWDF